MGRDYIDSARAAAEADRIASVAGQNLKQVLLSLKTCLQVVHKTRQMLEVDPECICVNSNNGEPKWERRKELDEAADFIENGIEIALCNNPLLEIETRLDAESDDMLVVQPKHGDDSNLLWCDRVCVHEKVDMDSAVWCTTPSTIMELVFARLPMDQLFQMRGLSKHWRDSIMSPSFQHAFGTRFAIVTNQSRIWSFGTRERKWYMLPFECLPVQIQCDYIVAGDGGLLCCQRQGGSKNLYVCNPLTQAWRRIPLPLQVLQARGYDLVHMVTNTQTKQYTITVVSTVVSDLQQNRHHQSGSAKATVEVYDSSTKTWSANSSGGGGIFQSGGNNLIYYKKYVEEKFVGIRVYNKTTGYSTSIPFDILDDIIISEMMGFFPMVVYQGQVYVLRVEEATSGVWMLRSPSHVWEKLYSVPKPEVLKYYCLSLVVSADMIIVIGDKEAPNEMDPEEPENFYFWMLDRAQGTWIHMANPKLDHSIWSQILFEMRLDAIP